MIASEYSLFAFRFRLGIGIYFEALTGEFFPDEQEDGTIVLGSFSGVRLYLPFLEILVGVLVSK